MPRMKAVEMESTRGMLSLRLPWAFEGGVRPFVSIENSGIKTGDMDLSRPSANEVKGRLCGLHGGE
jgi:hypothetical protein